MQSPNKFYVTLTLSLVLFLLGLVSFWAWQANYLTQRVQENLDIVIELEEEHTLEQRRRLLAYLSEARFTNPLTVPNFESKEAGLAKLDPEMARDLEDLGINNPLLDVITFNVAVTYLREDSLRMISEEVQLQPGVIGVFYQENFIEGLVRNARTVTLVLIGLTLLFLVIVSILIHNTVRISLSANRMLIKTQELVGASWWFISRPYLLRSIWQGLVAGCLAIGALVAMVYFADRFLPELEVLSDPLPLLVVSGGVLLLGILVNFLSYYVGVRRYLRLRIDDLY